MRLRRRDGRRRAGGRREGDERHGISILNAGLRAAKFQGRCCFTSLRIVSDARSGAGVQFQLWPRGSVWQRGGRYGCELLVEGWKIGSRFGGQLHFAKPTRAQLGERLVADLKARTRRGGHLLELHDIGKVRKNLWRLQTSGGIDQRLARMRRVRRIGEDVLPRMEGISALSRERFRRFAARAGLGFGTLHLHKRKIMDRAGPGEFRVLERVKVACGGRELRGGDYAKKEVPQGGGERGPHGGSWPHTTDP